MAENVEQEEDEGSFQQNRIQVSNVKKPLFFYVNLAQRLLGQHEVLEFSALGLAISTVVTVVEILKQNQFASITSKWESIHLILLSPAALLFSLSTFLLPYSIIAIV